MRYINNPALIRDMDTNLIVVAAGRDSFILPQRIQSGAMPFPLHRFTPIAHSLLNVAATPFLCRKVLTAPQAQLRRFLERSRQSSLLAQAANLPFDERHALAVLQITSTTRGT